MKIYCVIGYYDMDDGMNKGSKLHGCYTKLEDAKEKLEIVKKQLLEKFSECSDYFVKKDMDNKYWNIYGGCDMAFLHIEESYLSDFDVEEQITKEKVTSYLEIDIEDETLYPKLTDEELSKVIDDISNQMFEDYDRHIRDYFIQEMRNRAINHPIIQGKRIEIKKAARK